MLERSHEQARKRLDATFRAEAWKLNQETKKTTLPSPKSESGGRLSAVTLPPLGFLEGDESSIKSHTPKGVLRAPLLFQRQPTFGQSAFDGLWGCDDGLMVPHAATNPRRASAPLVDSCSPLSPIEGCPHHLSPLLFSAIHPPPAGPCLHPQAWAWLQNLERNLAELLKLGQRQVKQEGKQLQWNPQVTLSL